MKELDKQKVYFVYSDSEGNEHDQLAIDVVHQGSAVDPDTGDDMDIVRIVLVD